nr:diablo homolog, mitochondrial isoform X2 [Crassostrea gigas]
MLFVIMALYNTEKEYTKGIYTLIKLIEMRLENPGHPDQDKMEELIVETRIQVKSLKKKRQDLMMLLSVCQRLVNDASEAAYMAGAEFAGYTTNNKLTSSESFLSPCEIERVIAERHLSELEAHVIEVESKRAKEEEESETKQEEVKDDGNSGEGNEGLNSDSNTRDKKEDVKSEESTAKEKGDQSIDEGMEETDIAQKDTSISTETSPEADNKEFIPRMDYVETFNIGSQDESMEDD